MAIEDNAEAGPVTVESLLSEIAAEQKAQRDQLASMRADIDKQNAKQTQPQFQDVLLSAEQLYQQRMEEVAQHDYYCTACGRLYNYRRDCRGKAESPHPPVDVISTKELTDGDPTKHTPGPDFVGTVVGNLPA